VRRTPVSPGWEAGVLVCIRLYYNNVDMSKISAIRTVRVIFTSVFVAVFLVASFVVTPARKVAAMETFICFPFSMICGAPVPTGSDSLIVAVDGPPSIAANTPLKFNSIKLTGSTDASKQATYNFYCNDTTTINSTVKKIGDLINHTTSCLYPNSTGNSISKNIRIVVSRANTSGVIITSVPFDYSVLVTSSAIPGPVTPGVLPHFCNGE